MNNKIQHLKPELYNLKQGLIKLGYAIKCPIDTDEEKVKCFGATIGKALEPCNESECRILVFITLQ